MSKLHYIDAVVRQIYDAVVGGRKTYLIVPTFHEIRTGDHILFYYDEIDTILRQVSYTQYDQCALQPGYCAIGITPINVAAPTQSQCETCEAIREPVPDIGASAAQTAAIDEIQFDATGYGCTFGEQFWNDISGGNDLLAWQDLSIVERMQLNLGLQRVFYLGATHGVDRLKKAIPR